MIEVLQMHKQREIVYFSFPRWDAFGYLRHGFSSRIGGVSKGPFTSLNLGYKGGDNPLSVGENRKRFFSLWGKEEKELFCGEQVHGTGIFLVGKGALAREKRIITATDALITAEPGVMLGAFSADCLLAFFLDPAAPAVGLAHAGWRGTCKGLLYHVVEAMKKNFSSSPRQLQVLLSPSIRACCYEVGEEVLDFCSRYSWSESAVFRPGKRGLRSHFDLLQTNRNILLGAGLLPGNIFASNYCTCCNQHLFYSYRGAQGKATGSLMGLIFLAQALR